MQISKDGDQVPMATKGDTFQPHHGPNHTHTIGSCPAIWKQQYNDRWEPLSYCQLVIGLGIILASFGLGCIIGILLFG